MSKATNLSALREALEAYEAISPNAITGRMEAYQALERVARKSGFDVGRAIFDWARYQVAVGDVSEEAAELVGAK